MESQLTLEFFKNLGIIVALSMGLTQLIKSLFTGYMERFKPLLPLVIAIGLALIIFGLTTLGLLIGLMAGLTAAGVYDNVAIMKKQSTV